MRRLTLALVLLALNSGCATAPLPAVPTSAAGAARAAGGHLLIVGGGRQPPALISTFVALAGGSGAARIAVVPLASGEPAASGSEKVGQFRALGAEAFVLHPTRAEAESGATAARLAGVTGVWFTGGDQSRITAVLQGTPLLEAIRARYRAGAVIGGTSAGAAIMSDSMLTGSQYLPGQDTAGYYGDEYPRIARRTIEVVPGLGFLPGAIVDQHFVRRERQNRLLAVVLERPALLGVGIDESTALHVRPTGEWAVLGESVVLVYDARAAAVAASGTLGASGVALHLLPAGSTFSPATGRARLATTSPPRTATSQKEKDR